VVPSVGLRQELLRHFPTLEGKVTIIPNAVAVDRLRRPEGLSKSGLRAELGVDPEPVRLVFVALGHFERKGLPLILEAVAGTEGSVELDVVGGSPDLVRQYEALAETLGVGSRARFWGHTDDARRVVWAADALIQASSYEVFPLVCLEAAAAGVPVIATPVHGVVDFVVDGDNGMLPARTVAGIRSAIDRFVALGQAERDEMGARAVKSVEPYDEPAFVDAWREFFLRLS
jgi:glycosyltransferase involved in cell wall biosynthesis